MSKCAVALFAVLAGCGPLGLFGGGEAVPTEFEVVDLDGRRIDKLLVSEA